MSLSSRVEYQVVPMPTTPDDDGIGERVDLAGLETLLNAKHAEGWTTLHPIDFFAPALVFTFTHRRNLDEQVTEVIERLDDLDIWAPGVAEDLATIQDDIPEPARSRLVKAVLAVWH